MLAWLAGLAGWLGWLAVGVCLAVAGPTYYCLLLSGLSAFPTCLVGWFGWADRSPLALLAGLERDTHCKNQNKKETRKANPVQPKRPIPAAPFLSAWPKPHTLSSIRTDIVQYYNVQYLGCSVPWRGIYFRMYPTRQQWQD